MTRFLVAALALAAFAPEAHAACAGEFGDREVIGQIPDIVFVSGVPETRTIRHKQIVRPDPQYPYGECGSDAMSYTPGVYITSTYFDVGVEHGPGSWAGLSGSHSTKGVAEIIPAGIEVRFDGTAPAGTVGRIYISSRDGADTIYTDRVISIVNVYVIAANEAPPQTWFTVAGDSGSIAGNRLTLDHPLLNGNSNARMFVTHSMSPARGVGGKSWSWPHPISVSYDSRASRWSIQSDDGAAMPAGLAFNVRIDPSAEVQFHPYIDDPRANHNPYATIFVTAASPNPHPFAVTYRNGRWAITNSDGSFIQAGQKFFVQVMGATAYQDDRTFDPLGTKNLSAGVGVDIYGWDGNRTLGAARYLDFWWSKGQGLNSLPIILSANATPPGSAPVLDASYSGVAFGWSQSLGYTWSVRHENNSAMASNAGFNLWAPPSWEAESTRPPVTECTGTFSCICGSPVCVDGEWTCGDCHSAE